MSVNRDELRDIGCRYGWVMEELMEVQALIEAKCLEARIDELNLLNTHILSRGFNTASNHKWYSIYSDRLDRLTEQKEGV